MGQSAGSSTQAEQSQPRRTHRGTVERVMVLGPGAEIISTPVPQVRVTREGFEGDRHAGKTRRADARSRGVPKGALIANKRQVSLVSTEELARVAQALGIERVEPEWLGANLALSGIPNLTQLPPGCRFHFPDGPILVVDGENKPCTGPGRAIQSQVGGPDRLAQAFPKAAMGLRGLVGWVERGGMINVGDGVEVAHPATPSEQS